MLFRKEQDIPGKYLSLIIASTQKLFEDGDIHYTLSHLCSETGIEFAAVAEQTETGVIFFDSTISHLKDIAGNNPTIARIIQQEEAYATTQLTDLLTGILDVASIENIQYAKRVKNVIAIAQSQYLLLVAGTSELGNSLESVLKTILKLIVTYRQHVLKDRNQAEFLLKENKMLNTLRSFTNFSILKTNFSDIAEFAVNQIAQDLDLPSVMIVLRDGNSWKPTALTASPLILKVQQLLGQNYYKFSLDDPENNKAIQSVLNSKTFKTNDLQEVLCPPLESGIAKKIQEIQQARLIYVMPLEYRKAILGCIIYLLQEKEVDTFKEDLLRDYALQLSIAFANAQNISSMSSSKETIEQAYKSLVEVNKEKDNLMSMASHELRSPATVARNAISLINEYKITSDPNLLEKIEMVKEATDRELSIINAMLEMSRINTKKMELVYQETNVEKLIQTAVEELRIEAEKKNLRLTYDNGEATLPMIKLDPIRIREVIDNLLTNAIKYTEKGGITVKSHLDKDSIVVSVQDTGRGIADDVQASLFQMFHRITTNQTPINQQDSHQGGLGLGLFIAKNIIDAHKGTLSVESKLGEGSTFYFTLPL